MQQTIPRAIERQAMPAAMQRRTSSGAAAGFFEPLRKATVRLVQHRLMTDEERKEVAAKVNQPWQVENQRLIAEAREEKTRSDMLTRHREQLEQRIGLLEKDVTIAQTAFNTTKEKLAMLTTAPHPTYGQLLLQSGNRRVFATCPIRLTNKELFPTYHSQRAYRDERADMIAASVRKDDRFQGFPGMISMFELIGEAAAVTRGNQVRGIVDGQHRVGAVAKLLTSGHWPQDRKVVTEIFSVSDPADAARLFLQINKMQPVLDVDLVPMQAAIADSAESNTESEERSRLQEELFFKSEIDDCVNKLETEFKSMFKETPRCRSPHLHADTLRDLLFKNPVARGHAMKGKGELLIFVLNQNKALGATLKSDGTKEFQKAVLNKFFLGLSKTWLQ